MNVNPTFNKREVTVNFKMLVGIYYPDKYYNNIKGYIREEWEEKFKKLSNA